MVGCSQLPSASQDLLCLLELPDLNPNYVDNPLSPRGAFSILIERDGTQWDFSKFYGGTRKRGDMYIEDNRGSQRGRASFTIVDCRDQFSLPFGVVPGLNLEIWNQNQTDLFFSGMILDVKPKIIAKRCDGTFVKEYKIEAVDLTIELERFLVTEVYKDVTVGFVIKDLIRRYTCLDDSKIDATAGKNVDVLHVNGEYVSEVLERLLEYQTGWTYFIDPTTRQFCVGEDVDIFAQIPVTIDEDNVFEFFDFDSVSFRTDIRGLRNCFRFFYNSSYTTGLCNVANGSNVVFGVGTFWIDDLNIEDGASFKVAGDSKEYSIDTVNNDGELILSSNYDGATASSVEYEIFGKGMRRAISKSNISSISRMEQLRGNAACVGRVENGRFEARITDDGNRYTRAEATQILNTHLQKWSNPILSGKLKTDSARFYFPGLRAGQTLDFDLPDTCSNLDEAIVNRLIRRDMSGIICDRNDGTNRIDPLVSMELDFSDQFFDFENQIKRMMQNLEKQVLDDLSDVIEVIFDMPENIIIQDCVDIFDPVIFQESLNISDDAFEVPPTIITETINIDDDVTMTPVTYTLPYYTTPTPRQAGYMIGRTRFSAMS